MSRFLSDRFAGMKAYVPGEQPQGRSYIKLNTNESPFPPSPAVLDALSRAEAEMLNLYPDPDARVANAAFAAHFGCKGENVLLGNGSDEILAFCFQAYCDSNTPACFADITYGFYKVFAALYCLPSRVLPLDGQLQIRPEDYFNIGGTIFLANPNAPTGQALPLSAIEDILRANPHTIVVIDEAYSAFGAESAVPLTSQYENLIVVQTMSKSRNLAGARLGYAIASDMLIADLNKMKFSFNPYNVNRLSLLAATAAIQDEAYYADCVHAITQTREHTTRALRERGFFVLPSAANFIFAKPGRLTGEDYYLQLKQNGILVRHFDQPRISDYVRITIGTDEQMQALIQTTDKIWRAL